MNVERPNGTALLARGLRKSFRRSADQVVVALDDVSIEVAHGTLAALVGPDGGGKTTFIRLAAGLMSPDAGELHVLGVDVAVDSQQIQDRIGYMPQRFGLYEDLTVQENLDLYADLHGVTPEQREVQYPRLMEMTALGPFVHRLSGKLSGGMKQKLGLACTLVRSPELLLLDEPTVGVDPLSRRELRAIISQLVREQGLTVLMSTSYLDEAESCEQVVVLHHGKVLAQGPPAKFSALAAGRTFLADPPAGQPARSLQSRLLDEPDIIDAVPEGGRVRLVMAQTSALGQTDGSAENSGPRTARLTYEINAPSQLQEEPGGPPPAKAGIQLEPAPARFEDAFMILLRQAVGAAAAGVRGAKILPLRPTFRGGKSRLLRQRLRPARPAPPRTHRLGDAAI
jgi:ABC-2 type transport system ATP-binding protein